MKIMRPIKEQESDEESKKIKKEEPELTLPLLIKMYDSLLSGTFIEFNNNEEKNNFIMK